MRSTFARARGGRIRYAWGRRPRRGGRPARGGRRPARSRGPTRQPILMPVRLRVRTPPAAARADDARCGRASRPTWPSSLRSDPAVARLLPDASRDDPELAQSFRRLTEQDLRERKRDSLGLAAAALRRSAPVVLDDSEAQALLKGLTDVRLVLAERLGIATDEDAEFLHAALAAGASQGGQEWAKAAELYEVVTYLQEELVHTLLPSG